MLLALTESPPNLFTYGTCICWYLYMAEWFNRLPLNTLFMGWFPSRSSLPIHDDRRMNVLCM